MDRLPAAFEPLREFAQFVIQRAIRQPDGSTTKIPLSPSTMRACDAHDPTAWMDADTAIALSRALGPDIAPGFVLTEQDPFFFLDIDHAYVNGVWSPIALELVTLFDGAAVEIGVSGDGLHILGTGAAVIPSKARKKNTELGIELYTCKRIARISGNGTQGDVMRDCSVALSAIVPKYFPVKEQATDMVWNDKPRTDWCGPEDDDELIELALNARANPFGTRGCAFVDLWNHNVDVLAARFPHATNPYDLSSADGSLSSHLAFWTGCHHERIKRIMMKSPLVRDKWTERDDYLRDTIESACNNQMDVFSSKRFKPAVQQPTPQATNGHGGTITGWHYIPVIDQLKFFDGCVYVTEQHRVLLKNGMFVKPDAFRARFGGHTFAMDDQNLKLCDNAWRVFTESQSVQFPKVDSITFRPDLKPNEVVTEEGIVSVNTYRPVNAQRIAGDAGPFLQHLAKVLPNERDQTILLSYMAACVQHLGRKFQWAPLLQGVEGNGKTLFTRCVGYCVGKRYTHWPKAADLANKFNAWLLENAFIGVEDIYVPESRGEIIETLKPMITGDQIEIQGKGDNQISKEICCNFMLNSNHKNAIRKTRNDRRFCVFYTAQQSEDDLRRDGMGADYFPDLYSWLKDDGYAIVHDYLATYDIPQEFNPCLEAGGKAHRAPVTSTTNEALEASLGGIEQEILEAIEQNRPGFAGGWVSSIAVEKLLHDLHASSRLPRTKRKEMMMQLGYVEHPGLPQGRVTRIIPIDQGRPKLFVLAAEPHLLDLRGDSIIDAYVSAQQGQGLPIGGSVFDKHPVHHVPLSKLLVDPEDNSGIY